MASSTSGTGAVMAPTLMNIPTEIRSHILQHLFAGNVILISLADARAYRYVLDSEKDANDWSASNIRPRLAPNVLLASKQLHAEGIAIYYDQTQFSFIGGRSGPWRDQWTGTRVKDLLSDMLRKNTQNAAIPLGKYTDMATTLSTLRSLKQLELKSVCIRDDSDS